MKRDPNPLLKSRSAARVAYLALGFGCMGVAFINLLIPGLPSTVFLIAALWAFSKSSPRMELWLLEHPWFGRGLRNWREHRVIPRRAKVLAISTIWICMTGTSLIFAWRGWALWVPALLLVGAGVTWYLATRRSDIDGALA